jgi:hypothetical protein
VLNNPESIAISVNGNRYLLEPLNYSVLRATDAERGGATKIGVISAIWNVVNKISMAISIKITVRVE